MSAPKHSALFRDSLGGLTIRHFPSAEDAQKHHAARELAEPAPAAGSCKGWTPARLAKELGLSKRTINRRCEADLLPHMDHGTPDSPRRIIPAAIVKLVRIYGLAGVARMRSAGQL
jgi:hypothetical protein